MELKDNLFKVNLGHLKKISLLATAGLLLSACAGSANNNEPSAEGSGFEYGAAQVEVDEAIADLEPVTLTYQPYGASESSFGAPNALMFKDYIEEHSNGKIEIDIVWAQAIAPYGEVQSALADGRLDIAYDIPAYSPDEFPVFNALMAYSQFGPSSGLAGELVNGAMIAEVAWNNEALMTEFSDLGLTPLSPMMNAGEYNMMCNENNVGAEAEDWQGRSVRAGSRLNEMVITGLGASPVSMQFSEMFEGLQRNTVDCTFSQFAAASDFGVPAVAPNISYPTESSFAGRPVGVQLAGSSWDTLPLAYKQIIFDAEKHAFAGWQYLVLDSIADGVAQAVEAGGEISPLPDEVEETVAEAQLNEIRAIEEAGLVGTEVEEQARESAEKWAGAVSELGYEDGGTLADINEWYNRDEVDFLPFTTEVYEEVVLPHRPQ